jgi:hypothetical protein
MLNNSDITVNNIIASGKKFSDTSVIGKVLSIGNDEQEFEQIYIETEEEFTYLFKDDYCGVPIKEEYLKNFVKKNNSIITSYSIDISTSDSIYKVISISIKKNNQYVYIREGEIDEPRYKDNIINVFNSDYNGELFVHYIQNLYKILTNKELNI